MENVLPFSTLYSRPDAFRHFLIFTVSQEVFITARIAFIYDQRCLVIFISCRIKRLMLPGSDW